MRRHSPCPVGSWELELFLETMKLEKHAHEFRRAGVNGSHELAECPDEIMANIIPSLIVREKLRKAAGSEGTGKRAGGVARIAKINAPVHVQAVEPMVVSRRGRDPTQRMPLQPLATNQRTGGDGKKPTTTQVPPIAIPAFFERISSRLSELCPPSRTLTPPTTATTGRRSSASVKTSNFRTSQESFRRSSSGSALCSREPPSARRGLSTSRTFKDTCAQVMEAVKGSTSRSSSVKSRKSSVSPQFVPGPTHRCHSAVQEVYHTMDGLRQPSTMSLRGLLPPPTVHDIYNEH